VCRFFPNCEATPNRFDVKPFGQCVAYTNLPNLLVISTSDDIDDKVIDAVAVCQCQGETTIRDQNLCNNPGCAFVAVIKSVSCSNPVQ